jgi:hypothetical protein
MARAFIDTVWAPGQPLDPQIEVLGNKELSDRLLYLEKRLSNPDVDDLPLSDLQSKMEQGWLPDPTTLFASGTISFDSLSFTIVYGAVSSTGVVLGQGPIDFTAARNGAGDYTITFQGFGTVPFPVAFPFTAGASSPRLISRTATTARFGFAADTDFIFMVIGK